MLKAFRRHNATCKYKDQGRSWTRCSCWYEIDGSAAELARVGMKRHQSLNTNDSKEADQIILDLNTTGKRGASKGMLVTVEDAIKTFIETYCADLAQGSEQSYKWILDRLLLYTQAEGIRYVSQIDINVLEAFRKSWTCAQSTAKLYTILLKVFFKYALEHKWSSENAAESLKKASLKQKRRTNGDDDEDEDEEGDEATSPYTIEQMTLILATIRAFILAAMKPKARVRLIRLYGLVLVMRYSGLRISDATRLRSNRIVGDQLILKKTKKSKTPVSVTLPPIVLDALDSCPRMSPDRWFSFAGASRRQREDHYRPDFDRVLAAAKIAKERYTFHRLRDTFAVEELRAGTRLEDLKEMLGHKNIQITMKHYLKWVVERQQDLNARRREQLKKDPLLHELARIGSLQPAVVTHAEGATDGAGGTVTVQ